MKEKNMRRKKIEFIICLLVFFCIVQMSSSVFADTPLILSLNLKGQALKTGENTEVIVSMENYDESFSELDITTVIIEVSVDTARLKIDSDRITPGFEDKSGNGFLICRMSDHNNVELQYLNLTSPIEKGTKGLYSFEVTALQDIDQLSECLQISYAIMEDGSKTEIEEFELITTTKVAGSIVEQVTIDHSYTSEYGTMKEHPSASEIVSQLIEKETNQSEQETTRKENQGESQEHTLAGQQEKSEGGVRETSNQNTEDESENNTSDKKIEKEMEKTGSIVPILVGGVVIAFLCVTVISMIMYRRKRQSQSHE